LLTPIADMDGALAAFEGKPITVGIRAESIEVLSAPAAGALEVTVTVLEPLGSQNLLTIHVGSDVLKVSTHPDLVVRQGDPVWLRIPPHKMRWINPETGQSLLPVALRAAS
jgi:ABC-type sugar transport system ATPase subunit